MEDNKSEDKVLVVIKGGLVQSLYTSSENIMIDILDLDEENFETRLLEENELIKRSAGLLAVL